jgi:hypothetical protein
MAKFAYKDDTQKFAFEDFFGRRLCDFRKFICRLLHSPGRNRPGSGQPTSNRRTDPMHLATRWDRYSRRWLLVPERAHPQTRHQVREVAARAPSGAPRRCAKLAARLTDDPRACIPEAALRTRSIGTPEPRVAKPSLLPTPRRDHRKGGRRSVARCGLYFVGYVTVYPPVWKQPRASSLARTCLADPGCRP